MASAAFEISEDSLLVLPFIGFLAYVEVWLAIAEHEVNGSRKFVGVSVV